MAREQIQIQRGVGFTDLWGFGASYLGLRSSDSLQPRLSNYGLSALRFLLAVGIFHLFPAMKLRFIFLRLSESLEYGVAF